MTNTDYVLRSVDGHVATLTLNEPEARNPLSPRLVDQLTAHLAALRDDDAVRVVVTVGAGKGYCAGADLRRMRNASPIEDRNEYDSILELNRTLWRYPKPTIAAVHGFALGAGANLALWHDMTVVDPATRMGYPEVKAGVPSATVIPTLMRMVGRKRLYDLVLTGRTLTAAEAFQIGIVSRVSESDAAYATALEMAGTISAINPDAMRYTKEIVHMVTDMSYEQAIVYAKDLRVISRLRDDFKVEIQQGGSDSEKATS